MEDIRKKYKVESKEKDKEKNNREHYDVASYPFGAEEMLLKEELKELDGEER